MVQFSSGHHFAEVSIAHPSLVPWSSTTTFCSSIRVFSFGLNISPAVAKVSANAVFNMPSSFAYKLDILQ